MQNQGKRKLLYDRSHASATLYHSPQREVCAVGTLLLNGLQTPYLCQRHPVCDTSARSPGLITWGLALSASKWALMSFVWEIPKQRKGI